MQIPLHVRISTEETGGTIQIMTFFKLDLFCPDTDDTAAAACSVTGCHVMGTYIYGLLANINGYIAGSSLYLLLVISTYPISTVHVSD